MARKETITKQYLLDTAFELACNEGIENVTARKLSARAGCSTQPIFRLYENMEALWADIFEKSVEYFADHCKSYVLDENTDLPFIKLGMCYIDFAVSDPNIFRMLFLSNMRFGKSFYEILNGRDGIVAAEMSKVRASGNREAGEIFTNMWIFIHGAACMSITGDYDLDKKQTYDLLVSTLESFM